MGEIKDPSAVAPLSAALNDANNDVRINATRALGKIEDSSAVAPLIAALKNTLFYVRSGAASALEEIKDPRAVAPLAAFRAAEALAALKESAEELKREQLQLQGAAPGTLPYKWPADQHGPCVSVAFTNMVMVDDHGNVVQDPVHTPNLCEPPLMTPSRK